MLEILATIKDLCKTNDDGSKTIELSNVCYVSGEVCQGKLMKVVFMSNEEWTEYRKLKIAKDNNEIEHIG